VFYFAAVSVSRPVVLKMSVATDSSVTKYLVDLKIPLKKKNIYIYICDECYGDHVTNRCDLYIWRLLVGSFV
jgi:hypothetical protein